VRQTHAQGLPHVLRPKGRNLRDGHGRHGVAMRVDSVGTCGCERYCRPSNARRARFHKNRSGGGTPGHASARVPGLGNAHPHPKKRATRGPIGTATPESASHPCRAERWKSAFLPEDRECSDEAGSPHRQPGKRVRSGRDENPHYRESYDTTAEVCTLDHTGGRCHRIAIPARDPVYEQRDPRPAGHQDQNQSGDKCSGNP